jgi:hypothetical protein
MPYKNKEDKKKYQKSYSIRYRELNSDKLNAAHRKYWKNNKTTRVKYRKEYNMKNKIKIKAHSILNNKFRNIEIIPNCSICNSNRFIIKHHPDYNYPLNFIFLCQKCHMKLHRK